MCLRVERLKCTLRVFRFMMSAAVANKAAGAANVYADWDMAAYRLPPFFTEAGSAMIS